MLLDKPTGDNIVSEEMSIIHDENQEYLAIPLPGAKEFLFETVL